MFNYFKVDKPVIGMIHLLPLPGSPKYDSIDYSLDKTISKAVKEAKIYQECGVDGIQIENQWDRPFIKSDKIGFETVAAMSVVVNEVSKVLDIPYGVNVHMNGALPALAIAQATGARWIRVFEYISAYISYTGLTEGVAGELARYRSYLQANDRVDFYCDVNVKHGSHFIVNDRHIKDLAYDAQEQGADSIIITGFQTGEAPSCEKVKEASSKTDLPIFLGSGVNQENISELITVADGFIVGSYFKKDGKIENELDPQRIEKFMNKVCNIR